MEQMEQMELDFNAVGNIHLEPGIPWRCTCGDCVHYDAIPHERHWCDLDGHEVREEECSGMKCGRWEEMTAREYE